MIVGIGVHGKEGARLHRRPHVGVAQIEPEGVCVDLQRRPVLRRRLREGVEIGVQPLALVDDAARGVADDVHERMADGAQEALGRLRAILLEGDVRRRHDDVELREQVVVVVEPAI